MLRIAVLALALVPLAACADDDGSSPAGEGAATSEPAPAPRESPQVITEADSRATFTLPTGGETSLRLSSDWVWEEPILDGDAVQLVPVNYLRDPGFSEWVVMGVAPARPRSPRRGRPPVPARTDVPSGHRTFR